MDPLIIGLEETNMNDSTSVHKHTGREVEINFDYHVLLDLMLKQVPSYTTKSIIHICKPADKKHLYQLTILYNFGQNYLKFNGEADDFEQAKQMAAKSAIGELFRQSFKAARRNYIQSLKLKKH